MKDYADLVEEIGGRPLGSLPARPGFAKRIQRDFFRARSHSASRLYAFDGYRADGVGAVSGLLQREPAPRSDLGDVYDSGGVACVFKPLLYAISPIRIWAIVLDRPTFVVTGSLPRSRGDAKHVT